MISSRRGFTLTEILIALAIFAVAVTGVLTLFPLAQRTEKEGEEAARSALIAESIMGGLHAEGSGPQLSLAVSSVPATRWELLDPLHPAEQSVAFDASCEPLRPLSPVESQGPLSDRAAVAVATLRLSRKPSLPSLCVAEVDISFPASAAADARRVHHYVRLLPLPPHA
jgi:prepilin-type N-terminal cleavage/methylation domain-containing protein